MSNSNPFTTPATLGSIILKTAEGAAIDIALLVKEINVYESLFHNFVTASVTIVDTPQTRLLQQGLKTALDEISFSFGGLKINRSPEKPLKLSLYVYKTEMRAMETNQTAQSMVIHLAPKCMFFNSTKDISRYFSGKITNNVKKLAKELQISLNDIEVSDSEMRGIYSYKSPFELINMFAARCRPSRNKNDVNYIFYQTIDNRYHFRSIGSLLETRSRVGVDSKSGYQVQMPFDLSSVELKQNVLSHDSSSQSPYKNATSGMLTSSVQTFDMTTKTYTETGYSYDTEFSKQTHLSKKKITDSSQYELFSELVGGTFLSRYTQKGRYAMTCKDPVESQDKVGGPDDWLLKRISLMQQITQMSLLFTVPGTSENVSVGDTFYFGRPIQQQLSQHNKEKDILNNGKFLATEVRHCLKYNQGAVAAEYTTIIKGIKDSIGDE